jgi:hypothetical protein
MHVFNGWPHISSETVRVPPKVGDWQGKFTEAPFFLFEFFHNSSGSRDNLPFVNDPKIVFGLSIHRGSINFSLN